MEVFSMTELNDFFKLASDETRFRIIVLLYQSELCVSELCHILSIIQPNISKHLIKLKDTKFVKTSQSGKYIFYTLNLSNTEIINFIESIVLNLESYPSLKKDSENLSKLKSKMKKTAEKYSSLT